MSSNLIKMVIVIEIEKFTMVMVDEGERGKEGKKGERERERERERDLWLFLKLVEKSIFTINDVSFYIFITISILYIIFVRYSYCSFCS
jgi:hypothetical protein